MSIKRKYLKSRPTCKVTFRVSKEAVNSAKSINLVGDFNNWDEYANPMRSLKNGAFSATIDLEINREYEFRYWIDGKYWDNDWAADKYVPTVYGDSENSVIVV